MDAEAKAKYEAALQEHKPKIVIGADECGYGAWAGPLYVCAAAVPVGWNWSKVNDSKKLKTVEVREDVFYGLKTNSQLQFEVATSDVEAINRVGLGGCLRACFIDAITKLLKKFPGALVVVDGEVQLQGIKYIHFPRADGAVPAVMAASVYGKVLRDREMVKLAASYPGYGLGDHAGYGTPQHEEALRKKGMTPAHRKYTPMERIMTGKRGPKHVDFDDDVEVL